MKGICNLAVIPLRKQPDSTSEMVSQLLFGETFLLLETIDNWVKINTISDNYTGYISDKQFAVYNDDTDNWKVNNQYPYLEIRTHEGKMLLPAGCKIPNQPTLQIGKQEFDFSEHTYQAKTINDLPSIALKYLNAPYLWGGKTAFGIDCSGFTQMVYKQIGINIPRDAYQQAEVGTTLDFVNECKLGDLAFFDNSEGKITHVGLMLDEERIIHASGKVRIDVLDHHGILNNYDKKYTHKLRILKRII